MRKKYKSIFLCTMSASSLAGRAGAQESIPVRHIVGIHDTPSSNLTNGICPQLYSTTVGAVCSINESTAPGSAKIEMDAIGKFDEKTYDDFHKLETKPTSELVQKFFSSKKFDSASGIATISSYFNRSHISFTPIRLVQAYYLTNPVFPEVHYIRAMDSILSLQHTFQTELQPLSQSFRPGQLLLSIKPWIIQRNRDYLDADLSDILAGTKTKKSSSSLHQDINIAVRYSPGTPWFRGISLSAKNLNGSRACADCDDHLLDIDTELRRTFQISADFGGSFPVGAFILGVGVESQSEDEAKTPAKLNATAVYKLTSFGFYSAFNETITKVGFLYHGDFYKSGIIYTNEKQVNTLRFERKNETFLVVGCSL